MENFFKSLKWWLIMFIVPLTVFLSPVAFQICDIDQDGYISNGELFQVLKMVVDTVYCSSHCFSLSSCIPNL